MPKLHTVAKVGDIPEGTAKTFEIDGKLIAVFHQDGRFLALDDVCPHMGASLAGGSVSEGVVTCPWHGWRFRLEDGTWVDNPRLKTGCYTVRVVDDEIQIEV